MKEVTIQIPDDCEVKIVKKEEKKEVLTIKTYQDLIDNKLLIEGYYICENSTISNKEVHFADTSLKSIAISEKVAKSMLAMAMISQLMPYYGGEITEEEWKNVYSNKFTIERDCSVSKQIICSNHQFMYYFLAFHTKKQRDEFLKYNEQLVKDYLMID